jgi:hypothetical protein
MKDDNKTPGSGTGGDATRKPGRRTRGSRRPRRGGGADGAIARAVGEKTLASVYGDLSGVAAEAPPRRKDPPSTAKREDATNDPAPLPVDPDAARADARQPVRHGGTLEWLFPAGSRAATGDAPSPPRD